MKLETRYCGLLSVALLYEVDIMMVPSSLGAESGCSAALSSSASKATRL